MSNIYLTSCGLVMSIIISIIFFSKERANNIETKTFGYMLILNIFECAITTTIVLVALFSKSIKLLSLLNRIDFIVIITWCSLMLYYIFTVSQFKFVKKNTENYNFNKYNNIY